MLSGVGETVLGAAGAGQIFIGNGKRQNGVGERVAIVRLDTEDHFRHDEISGTSPTRVATTGRRSRMLSRRTMGDASV